jgi:hypothetical protein
MVKKAPRVAMMANYYDKLAKIFLTSGNSLYHATAWSPCYIMPSSPPSAASPDEQVAQLSVQSVRAAANAERRALSELSVRKEKEEASRREEFTRAKKLIVEQKEKEPIEKEIDHGEETKKLAQDLMKRGGLNVSIARRCVLVLYRSLYY